MTTVAIIQARMTSTRLPGKVLANLQGEPLLSYMLTRVLRAGKLDAVCVATTVNASDDPVAELCENLNVPVFRGDEADVLGRYVGAAKACDADVIVRLTADCPMIDPDLIDEAITRFEAGGLDYLSSAIELSYPDGLDIEIFTHDTLRRADDEARLPFHREHVTPYMRSGYYDDVPTGDFRVGHMRAPADFSHLRWTVDTPEDLEHVRRLVAELPPDYRWMDVLALLTRRPELAGCSHVRQAPVVLRRAEASDGDQLFEWVNREDCLAGKLRTAGKIPRRDHDSWFAAALANPDMGLWVIEHESHPVGQLRLEKRADALEVDIYLDAAARGKGVAAAALEAARREASKTWPGVPLLARIKPDNMTSRRLFAKAGYGKVTVEQDHLAYHRDPFHPSAGSA